ncbi:MAG: PQQ-binding-like beta-propeller repeat protein [Pirellulales bacterium]
MLRTFGILAGLLFAVQAIAADWPQFRGLGGSATSDSKIPVSWTPTENVAWKFKMPGPGVSSPIVVGNKVIVTCYSGYGVDRQNVGEIKNLMRHVICVDAKSGEKLWQADIEAVQPEDPYTGAGVPAHGYASHTPVSDGKNVYVFFGKTGALAFDLNGKQLWHTQLGKETDPMRWGSSSSPILYKDVLIVTASAESQSIVGLDTKTGKEIWKQEAKRLDNTWATPAIASGGGRDDLVVAVPGEVWGLDPMTGKLRWYSESAGGDQASTSPVISNGVIYTVAGGRSGGGTAAIKVGGSGDTTQSAKVWTSRDSSRFPSPIGYKSNLYLIANDTVTILNESNGEKVKQVRLQGGSGRGGGMGGDYPSPVIAGNYMYVLKGSGETFVFNLAGELEQVSINLVTADSESFGGTPAISDGRMFLRSDKHLYCVSQMTDVKPNASEALLAKLGEGAGGGGGRGGPGGGGGRGGPGGGPGGGRGGPGGPGGGGGFDPAAIFGRLDANSDGKVTKEELQNSPMADRFAELDKNKDSSLSQEEFMEAMRAMMAQGGGPGGGPGGGRGGPGGPGGGGGFGGGFGGRGGGADKPSRPDRPGT